MLQDFFQRVLYYIKSNAFFYQLKYYLDNIMDPLDRMLYRIPFMNDERIRIFNYMILPIGVYSLLGFIFGLGITLCDCALRIIGTFIASGLSSLFLLGYYFLVVYLVKNENKWNTFYYVASLFIGVEVYCLILFSLGF